MDTTEKFHHYEPFLCVEAIKKPSFEFICLIFREINQKLRLKKEFF
jgi:hypothetical protein